MVVKPLATVTGSCKPEGHSPKDLALPQAQSSGSQPRTIFTPQRTLGNTQRLLIFVPGGCKGEVCSWLVVSRRQGHLPCPLRTAP